jgi:hypothetical protein
MRIFAQDPAILGILEFFYKLQMVNVTRPIAVNFCTKIRRIEISEIFLPKFRYHELPIKGRDAWVRLDQDFVRPPQGALIPSLSRTTFFGPISRLIACAAIIEKL